MNMSRNYNNRGTGLDDGDNYKEDSSEELGILEKIAGIHNSPDYVNTHGVGKNNNPKKHRKINRSPILGKSSKKSSKKKRFTL
ncbi:MAG: hypothetical protein ACI9GH_000030 [Candidatus Paceibacteria bacterium]|jgi:hypothetical protein